MQERFQILEGMEVSLFMDVPEYEVWIRLKARLNKETRDHVEFLILDAFQGLEDMGEGDGLFRFGGVAGKGHGKAAGADEPHGILYECGQPGH